MPRDIRSLTLGKIFKNMPVHHRDGRVILSLNGVEYDVTELLERQSAPEGTSARTARP